MAQKGNKKMMQMAFVLFMCIGVACFFYFDLHDHLTKENIGEVKNYLLEFGAWTPVIIVFLYISFNVVGLPTLFFSVLCGYLYGLSDGFFLAWGGMTAGLFSSFICGRYLFRDHFISKYGKNKMVGKLEGLLKRYHFWAVVFTRLVMVFPYNLLNYIYSITSIRTSTYLVGSALGILVPTIIFAYSGELLTKGVELLGMIY